MVVVFAPNKFRQYLLLPKVIVFLDHAMLRFLMSKVDMKPRLIHWIFLLREFDIEIRDMKGTKNKATDHLSRIEGPRVEKAIPKELKVTFPKERLCSVFNEPPWFADIANYLVGGVILEWYSIHHKRILVSCATNYFWDELYLFKVCENHIIQQCVVLEEGVQILAECHQGPSG